MITLQNEHIAASVAFHGAELTSLRKDQHEYLWQANPRFWARHSPVLFPIVGRVWNDHYRIGNNHYQLSQHGFARDMDFQLIKQTPTEVWLALENNEDTLKKYPYPFRLEIGYRLQGMAIKVMWRVLNPADEEMFFQIGAHPAFYWPGERAADDQPLDNKKLLGWFRLTKDGKPVTQPLHKAVLAEKGCVDPNLATTIAIPDDGCLPLDFQLFSKDALVFEKQLNGVQLLTVDKAPYLSVDFDAPVVGLWSSPGKNAPFVCIEPWYGRCDRVFFDGDYRQKDFINRLQPHDIFSADYTITLH